MEGRSDRAHSKYFNGSRHTQSLVPHDRGGMSAGKRKTVNQRLSQPNAKRAGGRTDAPPPPERCAKKTRTQDISWRAFYLEILHTVNGLAQRLNTKDLDTFRHYLDQTKNWPQNDPLTDTDFDVFDLYTKTMLEKQCLPEILKFKNAQALQTCKGLLYSVEKKRKAANDPTINKNHVLGSVIPPAAQQEQQQDPVTILQVCEKLRDILVNELGAAKNRPLFTSSRSQQLPYLDAVHKYLCFLQGPGAQQVVEREFTETQQTKYKTLLRSAQVSIRLACQEGTGATKILSALAQTAGRIGKDCFQMHTQDGADEKRENSQSTATDTQASLATVSAESMNMAVDAPDAMSTNSFETEPAVADASSADGNTANTPPPLVMRGTLSYNAKNRKLVICGERVYEDYAFLSHSFRWVRKVKRDEDVERLPLGGEFHGPLHFANFHYTSKGKRKTRFKVAHEHDVKVTFVANIPEHPHWYTMTGRGTNQFGVFHIQGTAKPSEESGGSDMQVEFRKHYGTLTDGNDLAQVSCTTSLGQHSAVETKGACAAVDSREADFVESNGNVAALSPVSQPEDLAPLCGFGLPSLVQDRMAQTQADGRCNDPLPHPSLPAFSSTPRSVDGASHADTNGGSFPSPVSSKNPAFVSLDSSAPEMGFHETSRSAMQEDHDSQTQSLEQRLTTCRSILSRMEALHRKQEEEVTSSSEQVETLEEYLSASTSLYDDQRTKREELSCREQYLRKMVDDNLERTRVLRYILRTGEVDEE